MALLRRKGWWGITAMFTASRKVGDNGHVKAKRKVGDSGHVKV